MQTPLIIAKIALATPLNRLFDYQVNASEKTDNLIGCRVQVPFGRREITGLIIEITNTTDVPADKLKTVIHIIDDNPILTTIDLRLLSWAATYYHYPIGEVILSTLPKPIRSGKPLLKIKNKPSLTGKVKSKAHKLNSEQQKALQFITAQQQFQSILLQGVTGSGKTEVYLQAIDAILQQNKNALVLVPEIALLRKPLHALPIALT